MWLDFPCHKNDIFGLRRSWRGYFWCFYFIFNINIVWYKSSTIGKYIMNTVNCSSLILYNNFLSFFLSFFLLLSYWQTTINPYRPQRYFNRLGWLILWYVKPLLSYLIPKSFFFFLQLYSRLVGLYGISTIVGYLISNPLYTYILNIHNLVWLDFMAYQPL